MPDIVIKYFMTSKFYNCCPMFFPHFTIVHDVKFSGYIHMAMNVVIRVAYSSYVGQVSLLFDWFTTASSQKNIKEIKKNIENFVFLWLDAVGGCSFT